ncbi:SpoIIE family protein phosphatase [Streptomyces sp. Ru87]|uniref:SpoIIE family protein phosphatase n=1 Tax=Streptomyces sp. Ru87 TaxID=2044307 RepID=UPI00211D77DF|nr:SpoIIE family protein phosphatase [Streptomyces sp. Ru87]
MPGLRTPAVGPDPARSRLDRLLTEAVHGAGAYGGAVYLLAPDGRTLWLESFTGFPLELIAPWTRVSTTAPLPVTDAMRRHELVWVGGAGAMASRYPRTALILPYHFCLAAHPLEETAETGNAADPEPGHTGDGDTGDAESTAGGSGNARNPLAAAGSAGPGTTWGALMLLWPGSHPKDMSDEERARVVGVARRMTGTLSGAAAGNNPVLPASAPRKLAQPRTSVVGPEEAQAAVLYADRLPEGCCALDLNGHITYISRRGAELVGGTVEELVGTRPWRSLPWLADPVYEDRYRAALISRDPTDFTALRPPDHWLTFQLYPGPTGLSVRITPAHVRQNAPGMPGGSSHPAGPTRLGTIYQLMHLAGALTEAAGTQDVVNLAAEHLLPAFGAQGLVMTVTESGRMRIVGQHGYPEETITHFDGTPLTASSPGVRALTLGVPGFFPSREELERAYPARAALHDGMQAWAFLPLIASGRPVGTCVLAYDRPHAFAPDERAALASLSGLLAQALDRARLYDTKHRLAHGLQEGLLPHSLPHLPGRLEVAARYLPATQGMNIGGDFYDLIRLDAITVGAVIGDVQGHNVTAAALMGQVRTAVHANATAGASPDEVLARTNRLLVDLEPGLFTSCLYAHIDLSRHRALLASAGHLPPLLHTPGGPTEVLDVPPGLLLGIDPDSDYPVAEVTVPPGSVLAFYTDGLVESPGTDLDESIGELGGRLALHGRDGNLEDVADALVRSAGRGVDTDDIALLLLRPC